MARNIGMDFVSQLAGQGLIDKVKDSKNEKSENENRKKPIKAHAPYNFIEMWESIQEDIKLAPHNKINDEQLISGYLTYKMENQTPLMVDSGNDTFYQNKDGVYALPGSTIRGLIRNNVQILGFTDVRKDIDDYYLMYREVAGGALKKAYNNILGSISKKTKKGTISELKNVRAGYIKKIGDKYYLYKNVGDKNHTFKKNEKNYYIVSERYVLENAKKEFAYLVDNNKLQNLKFDKKVTQTVIKKENGEESSTEKIEYIGVENDSYVPYQEEIVYYIFGDKVIGIDKKGNGKKGYILSSGYIKNKKVFYVIPEPDFSKCEEIPEETILAYQADYKRKATVLRDKKKETKKDKVESNNDDTLSFYDLPKEGEVKPVFYIEYGGRLYIGYTPRLRLMYEHSVAEGIKTQPKQEGTYDYADSMFGFADDKESYKSKVYFTDAVLTNDKKCNKEDEVNLILAEPKPTSYMEYIQQSSTKGKEGITYNNSDFEIRGVKQYWLHEKVTQCSEIKNINVAPKVAPIEPGGVFEGKIRFDNLTEKELGLLIWSIRLEKESQMNLGKAKSYGYGRVKVYEVQVFIRQDEKIYDINTETLIKEPYCRISKEERNRYIALYQDSLAEWIKATGKKKNKSNHDVIYDNPRIKAFLNMKAETMPDEVTSYMSLEEFKDNKRSGNELPAATRIYNRYRKEKS